MEKKRKGLFITFEGIDGCGKTTQARLAGQWLKKTGRPVLFIREPGGTVISERIRRILLDRRLEVDPYTELLLYEAARAQLTSEKIIPALDRGEIVVGDRFFDSTTAYQGYGRGLNRTLIASLNRFASRETTPDITFIFDVDYQTSLLRRRARPDRLEREKQAFFQRVRKGFKSLAGRRRVVLLDGRLPVEELHEEVKSRIKRRLNGRGKRGNR